LPVGLYRHHFHQSPATCDGAKHCVNAFAHGNMDSMTNGTLPVGLYRHHFHQSPATCDGAKHCVNAFAHGNMDSMTNGTWTGGITQYCIQESPANCDGHHGGQSRSQGIKGARESERGSENGST